MKRVSIAAFSTKGAALARRIAAALSAEVFSPAKFAGEGVILIPSTLEEWTAEQFAKADAIIFVSACGIAVRSIAPFIKSKTTDPAVVVLDEMGHNVISLLSGHIGGANELTKKIAQITGGNAVVTTATDVHGLVAVDEWAQKNNCAIENIKAAKIVSAAILEGQKIGVAVTDELRPTPWPVTLWLRPRDLVLGVGCKKNIEARLLKAAFYDFMKRCGLSYMSVATVASIDIKKNEKAIIALAEELRAPFITYSAAELAKAEGTFTASRRVLEVTGVDNVCERAAVSGAKGTLLFGKTIYKGITLAIARCGR